ncbi:hypothetical protein [Paenibacillus xylanilyticus]|uniref:hypothetical protein n=1 Tax=Paenibacillus xylanilyticus TaxID=248903 RepID=UPI0039A2F06A
MPRREHSDVLFSLYKPTGERLGVQEEETHMERSEELEILLSQQPPHIWRRRKQELMHWTEREKHTILAKKTVVWNGVEVDAELLEALSLLQQAGVMTEFSCAGVSPLDEPVDHSLYAYVTLVQSETADQFVQYALKRMQNRLLVTLEVEKGRYDMSSFFIGHNRSFCWWMTYCAAHFMERNGLS